MLKKINIFCSWNHTRKMTGKKFDIVTIILKDDWWKIWYYDNFFFKDSLEICKVKMVLKTDLKKVLKN